MKVLMIDGCGSDTLLQAVTDSTEEYGYETIKVRLSGTVSGCLACGKCNRRKKCIVEDEVNFIAGRAEEICGLMVLCPLYYGEPDQAVTGFLTRLFRSSSFRLAFRPAALLFVSRTGEEGRFCSAFGDLLAMAEMPRVYGREGNVISRENGAETAARAAARVCWLAACVAEGRKAGIGFPEPPQKVTDFVR